jgi:peptide/nickel transport system substrate-binding protein
VKLAGAGAAGVSLAGCSGGGGSDNDGSSDDSMGSGGADDDTESSSGSGGSHMDNELIIIEDQGQGSLDPAKATDYSEALTRVHLYDPLLYIDPEKGTPISHLAEDWSSENDGRTWVITLKEGIPKHHGGTLTAEDVAYTMERYLKVGQGAASYWQSALETSGIEVRDERTVAFTFENPYGPFVNTVTQMHVVDGETLKEHETDGDYGSAWLDEGNVAGTGPYTIGNWERGSSITYTAFEDYWGGWESDQFGKCTVEVVGETSTAMNRMRLGDADILNQKLPKDNHQQLTERSNVQEVTTSWWNIFYMQMNTTKQPLDDPKVREAFFWSLDYGTVINEIYGRAERAAGVVPQSVTNHHNGDIPVSEQKPEKAKQALEESSYTAEEINEIGVEIWPMSTLPPFVQTSLLLKDNLQSVLGVEIEVVKKPWNLIVDSTSSPETTPHIHPVLESGAFPSAFDFTNYMFVPPYGTYYNSHWWENQELIDLLNNAVGTADPDARAQMYKEAQQIIFDAKPQFWVANPLYKNLLNTNVSNWKWYGPWGWDIMAYNLRRSGDGRASQ